MLRHSEVGRVNQDPRTCTRIKIGMWKPYRIFHLLKFIAANSDKKKEHV